MPQLPSLSPPQPALVVSILFLTLAFLIGISVWLSFHVDSDQHGTTRICESSSTYLLIGLLVFFLLHCKHSLYIPTPRPLSDVLFVNTFSHLEVVPVTVYPILLPVYMCVECVIYMVYGVCACLYVET